MVRIEGSFYRREKDYYLWKTHKWCLKEGTAEQVKLVDFFMFQEMVFQMGFQSETYCTINCLVRGQGFRCPLLTENKFSEEATEEKGENK